MLRFLPQAQLCVDPDKASALAFEGPLYRGLEGPYAQGSGERKDALSSQPPGLAGHRGLELISASRRRLARKLDLYRRTWIERHNCLRDHLQRRRFLGAVEGHQHGAEAEIQMFDPR